MLLRIPGEDGFCGEAPLVTLTPWHTVWGTSLPPFLLFHSTMGTPGDCSSGRPEEPSSLAHRACAFLGSLQGKHKSAVSTNLILLGHPSRPIPATLFRGPAGGLPSRGSSSFLAVSAQHTAARTLSRTVSCLSVFLVGSLGRLGPRLPPTGPFWALECLLLAGLVVPHTPWETSFSESALPVILLASQTLHPGAGRFRGVPSRLVPRPRGAPPPRAPPPPREGGRWNSVASRLQVSPHGGARVPAPRPLPGASDSLLRGTRAPGSGSAGASLSPPTAPSAAPPPAGSVMGPRRAHRCRSQAPEPRGPACSSR